MRLISLYIENFGTLSRYELNFSAGLTTVNEPNGFGKTTLAEFIRAMLYGFPRKSKTLEKSRRQKYAPWNGGQYGGNLVFEHEGQRYRVERTFGATPKGDTFTLIDLETNRKTNRLSEEIGIELFGLDSDSFERSTYLPQFREDGPLATASIQAKLSNLVEDSGDVANFDKAIAALRAKRSALIPYRGSGGAVAEAAANISRLQMQLDQAMQRRGQLLEVQNEEKQTEVRITEGQAALARVRQQLASAAEMSAVAEQQRQYEQLWSRYRQISTELIHDEQAYPKGLPDEEELGGAEAMADRWAVLTTQPTGQVKAEYPTGQEIDACRKKCEEYDALQTRLRNLQSAAAELLQAERNRPQESRRAVIGMIFAWLIGAAGLIGGAVLIILRQVLFGGIGLGIGAVAAVAGISLLVARKSKRRAQKKELDGKLQAVQRESAALRQNAEQYRREIGLFLLPHFGKMEPQQFLACLTRLEHDAQLSRQAQRQNAEAAECKAWLERFFSRYGLPMEPDVRAQLRRLRDDGRQMQTAATRKQELAQQIAAFRAEYGEALSAEVCQPEDAQRLRLEEQRLRSALTERTEALLHIRQRVQSLRAQTDQIPQLQDELTRWQQKQARNRENARILDDTMAFLQQARENLAVGYLGTIRSRFGHYLAQLEGTAGEKYLIDGDLQVQLERMGQSRELAYFSAGQTDLVMLCMRLALVDALFKGQAIFVILDDPFVNLDDAHTASAQRLLRKIAAERQILYLTCHSSRAM